MRKIFTTSLVLLITVISLYGQGGNQDQYLEAKRLFYNKDYVSAESAFLALKVDPVFGPYADFYRGLIQYQQSNSTEAIILWKQLLSDYPAWEKQLEVFYWLSVSHFQSGLFDEGLQYLNSYTDKSVNASLSNQLVSLYMKEVPIESLIEYQEAYPQLKSLAVLLASRISQLPMVEQDRDLLAQLIEDYDLPISSVLDIDFENVRKKYYDIAILLPFVFDGLDNPVATIRNNLVMDIYQGAQLAVEELSGDDINIRLHSYDTYKEADTVAKYAEELGEMDLIIGPLYPGPIEQTKLISQQYQVNMISPLTSNSSYMDENSLAFLAKPSYETMATQLANYVLTQPHKKSAFIYFSKDERDSVFAEIYRSRLVQDSIKILDFRSLDDLSAKQMLDSLTIQFEAYYPKDSADSIAEIEGRFIKTRSLREEESELELLDSLAYFEEDEDGEILNPEDPKRILSYEMKYKMPLDTVGHILIVSRSMSIYNNFVSAKAARQDSMGIYGYTNWFDNNIVNYALMDQVDAKLAAPDYYNKESETYLTFSEKIMDRYKKIPSDFHVQGYDLMTYLGRRLDRYGKYFQLGAYEEGEVSGVLYDGYDYPGVNDNQVVPIITLENYNIKKVN